MFKDVKSSFPIFERKIHGKPLVYLDSAATSQKPEVVLQALQDYYREHNANVHRGIHVLGDESTKLFHVAREKVASFFGAKSDELIWTRNTTESINTVAYAWARENLKEGDIIVTSELEHHSNLVTWQEVAKASGAGLVYVNVTEEGMIDLDELEELLEQLKDQVKLVALVHVSNATGAVLDVERVVGAVKKFAKGARVLLDAAQSAPHMKLNFKELGVDFLAFSGHKMYGPMGIGGLLVSKRSLEEMGPFLVGGGMINEVHLMGTVFGDMPDKYDAGTPNVAGAVGLSAAVDFLEDIGMEEVENHGKDLVEYAMQKLAKIKGLTIVGPRDIQKRLASVAFMIEGIHAHDVAQVLDSEGIAVRSGHHCTMPLHEKFGWAATTRASFGVYNSRADIDALVLGLEKVKTVFKV